jgi:TonB family protein
MITTGARTMMLASILLFCPLSVVSVSARQDPQLKVHQSSDASVFSFSERDRGNLKRILEASAESDIKALEADNAPIAIKEARVRGLKIEGNYDASPGKPAPMNDYVMQLSAKLLNRESRTITGLGVEFANEQSNSVFYVYHPVVEIVVNREYRLDISFMMVSGDPSQLTIRLVGVRFADETVWGAFPLPHNAPRHLSQGPSSSQAPPKNADESGVAPVDSRPRLLNNPVPRYTEEARLNRVMGTAGLRALIGADGSVQQVKVLRALPDGLTEQALRAAYSLKFEPAKRNDQPVPFWQTIQIEFNLK